MSLIASSKSLENKIGASLLPIGAAPVLLSVRAQ